MRKFVVGVVLLAVPLGGWAAVDQYLDVRYERLCIKHHADIPLCDTGYAAWAIDRCHLSVRPPGVPDSVEYLEECKRGWLKLGKDWTPWDNERTRADTPAERPTEGRVGDADPAVPTGYGLLARRPWVG